MAITYQEIVSRITTINAELLPLRNEVNDLNTERNNLVGEIAHKNISDLKTAPLSKRHAFNLDSHPYIRAGVLIEHIKFNFSQDINNLSLLVKENKENCVIKNTSILLKSKIKEKAHLEILKAYLLGDILQKRDMLKPG